MSATPIAPPQIQTGSSKCSVCNHEKASEINSALLTESARSVSRTFGIPLASLTRHHRNHLQNQGGSSPGSMGATAHDAVWLARLAKRHAKRLASAPDGERDDKALNGAITSADKALRTKGELLGELKSGPKIDIALTQVQGVAMALHESASRMGVGEVLAEAEAFMDAQADAGDAHALAAIARLSRKHLAVEPHAP